MINQFIEGSRTTSPNLGSSNIPQVFGQDRRIIEKEITEILQQSAEKLDEVGLDRFNAGMIQLLGGTEREGVQRSRPLTDALSGMRSTFHRRSLTINPAIEIEAGNVRELDYDSFGDFFDIRVTGASTHMHGGKSFLAREAGGGVTRTRVHEFLGHTFQVWEATQDYDKSLIRYRSAFGQVAADLLLMSKEEMDRKIQELTENFRQPEIGVSELGISRVRSIFSNPGMEEDPVTQLDNHLSDIFTVPVRLVRARFGLEFVNAHIQPVWEKLETGSIEPWYIVSKEGKEHRRNISIALKTGETCIDPYTGPRGRLGIERLSALTRVLTEANDLFLGGHARLTIAKQIPAPM